MERIIVRDRVLGIGHVNSAITSICANAEYKTFEQLEKDFGIVRIMKEVFLEDISSKDFLSSDLYLSFTDAQKVQKDNSDFKYMYRVDVDFAVHLSANIYLYHLVSKDDVLYPHIIPWYYVDSRVFLGDTWWESDEEILQNLIALTTVEFLKRYKGY